MLILSDTVLSQYRDRAVAGLQAFCHQNKFKSVVVGCSGGMDSALTLALAVEALGASNVVAITMPTKFSSVGSVQDSIQLANNLGIQLHELPIQPIVDSFASAMAHIAPPTGVAYENLQARTRGTALMTYANLSGALLLSTGNKSEGMTGYATLYGDTCGGLNLIGDLYKTEVWELARFLNRQASKPWIPEEIIDKQPSAELAPGQKDQDSLPPYATLDSILVLCSDSASAHPLHPWATAQLAQLSTEEVDRISSDVANRYARNKFKQLQVPPTILMDIASPTRLSKV